MKRNLFVVIFVVFLALFVRSQSIIPQNIENIFNNRKELYFKFTFNQPSELAALSNIISIDGKDGQFVYAYANKSEFQQFLGFNLSYTVLPPPSTLFPALMRDNIDVKSINAWDFYPTYGGYESMMYQYESNYPGLCKIYNMGTLNSGRKLLVAKITNNINQPGNKPRFNYSSSMHGDELTGYVLMLRFIDYLLANYGTNSRVTYLVNNIEIWITPLANPDGTYTNDNSTVNGATRNNANGVDLNRNFRNPVGGDHPDGNAWQQENIITMAFADTMNFTMSANFHGGIECVNYPWDTWLSSARTHADHVWWQMVSHEYADTARFYSPSSYMNPSGTNFYNGITHGGDWYVVRGSRQDYLTYYNNSREVTLEISNTKLPSASTLPSYWDYNYRSFLNYMQQSLYGLRGIVTDSCTALPLKTEVFITGHDVDNSQVYTFMPLGNYHRPLLAGNYTVRFSAPGYQTKTYNSILVTNYNTTTLNVALVPLAPQATVSSDLIYTCNGQIAFDALIDNADTWEWFFGDGSSSTSLNPVHIYNQNGVYHPYLELSNCSGTHQVYLADSILVDLPLPPVANDETLCSGGNATLTANGTGHIQWFANMTDTVPLDTGNVFITPVLNQTTQYFVNQNTEIIGFVGETNSNSNGNMFSSATQHYQVFDCFVPVRLLSVEVNASSSGNRTFYLRNSMAQVLDSVTVYVNTGVSRITLDLDIPVGNNLQLAGPLSPNLYRSSSGLSYPYELLPYLSIKSSSATTNPTGYYYYFYDWEVLTGSCESSRVPVSVQVTTNPHAEFDYVVYDLQVEFENLSNGGTSYIWSFGDASTATSENPVHTYAAYGTYTVQLIAVNDCGNDTINYVLNLSNAAPVVDFMANITGVVEGGFVQFSDLSLNNPNLWTWYFEGGTPSSSTQKNPLIQYNTPGIYEVKLTVANGFGTDSLTKNDYIEVFEAGLAPVVNFTASQTTLNAGDSIQFTDLSTYAPTTWLWNFEGGTPSSSSLQNPYVKYNIPGTYFVTLVASNAYGNGFENKTDYILVEPSSVSDLFQEGNLLFIYPNPVSDKLYVNLSSISFNHGEFEIFNVIGRRYIIDVIENDKINSEFTFDISNMPEGVYYLRLNINDKHYIDKFIIMRP
ncbi:MAG: PKD domain-containing protein [Bacteroidales bacterium]|nr:PKD domain-containing protein [Bacteroidales bacterium]